MNKYFFSKTALAVYPEKWRARYENAGTWPDDAIELTDEEVAVFAGSKPPAGKKLGADENGRPAWVDIPPLPLDEQFQAEMDTLNAQYDRDMIEATNKYNVAVARDGSTETEKVNDARALIADLDAQYDADQLAIINKYYGN